MNRVKKNSIKKEGVVRYILDNLKIVIKIERNA